MNLFVMLPNTYKPTGDYVPDSQRAELVFYNKTIVKDMHFRYGKYNRTISAMNASYVLLRDFTDAKMMGPYHITNFIFDSDVYPKYMPKGLWRVSIKVNHENVGEILFVRWGVNASFDVVRDFTNQKIMATLKAYQFYHNEYRFTGTQITADICKIERANVFSLKEQFKEAQFNMNLCNVKKVDLNL
ncbi:hypothetical protein TcasGA2_TC016298 [Tribolium castaneum]|uniref:Uncharacterized protein n=1 Tax=Tribolium castaneum TaxID=7070 RepID=D6X2Y1_TRICA|nr:hypothetical protein TcasGA2_TC016298 [Tribolium castaneum]